jgi:hypothetical protein
VSRQRYVFGESQLQRLNSLLAQYEGTHNYHNFTVSWRGGGGIGAWGVLGIMGQREVAREEQEATVRGDTQLPQLHGELAAAHSTATSLTIFTHFVCAAVGIVGT